MALLKAFVCQVVLFGLYKLFLEEVVEAHLVPDELTRNCIVGFVCLMCFGIQLYTDIPDEDYAEADENPKAKSESSGESNTKKSQSSQISATHEMVGSNTTSRATANTGIFAQFSPNMPDTIKVNGTETSSVPASTVKTSYNQEVTTNPVLNGFSETTVCEESDDDGIEIDQFVGKKSDKEKLEQFETVKDAERIKTEYVTEEVKQSIADESEKVETIKGEDVETIKSEDVNQSRTNEDEGIKLEEGTEADVEAEEVKSKAVETGEVKSKAVEAEDVTEPEQSATVEAEGVAEPEQSATVEAEGVAESEQSATVEAEAEGVTESEQSATVEAEAEGVAESEQSATAEDVMVLQSEDAIKEVSQSKTNEEAAEAVKESKCWIANGKAEEVEVLNPQVVTEEVKHSTAIEDEIEAAQSKEAAVESECLMANRDDNLPTPDSDKNTNLKIGESSEAQMTNGIAEESLNNINSISLNVIEETKSKKSVKDEIGNGHDTILSSQPDECTNDIKESLPSLQEISNTISISTKVVNNLGTDNTNNTETTTLVLTEVSSPSEKLTVSTTRQKATVAAEVCVAPINTIDISFIYACH